MLPCSVCNETRFLTQPPVKAPLLTDVSEHVFFGVGEGGGMGRRAESCVKSADQRAMSLSPCFALGQFAGGALDSPNGLRRTAGPALGRGNISQRSQEATPGSG